MSHNSLNNTYLSHVTTHFSTPFSVNLHDNISSGLVLVAMFYTYKHFHNLHNIFSPGHT